MEQRMCDNMVRDVEPEQSVAGSMVCISWERFL